MWCRHRRKDEDFREEIDAHLAGETARLMADGLNPEDARHAALRSFGNITRAQERFYESRRVGWIDDLRRDLRYAIRTLSRTPAFTAVAVLTLALGIGANTAIFSLVNGLLLRPLPVRNPEQLVLVADPSRGTDLPPTAPNQLPFMWSYPMWAQIRQRSQLFDGAFGYFSSRFNLASGGERELVDGLYASGKFFETLAVTPVLGRALTDADDQRGGGSAGPVAVVSHGLWQRRFGGAADVIGRRINLERVPFTIVGVLPHGFAGPTPGRALDVVIPVGMASVLRGPTFFDSAGANWITIMARLKPGQTLDAAITALRGVQPQIREASLPAWPPNRADSYLKNPLTLLPAGRGNPIAPLRVRSERPLWTMQLAVALVLLIACANVANLSLARSMARRHEMSVRLALGASRWRLARQLFAESFLVATIGAAGGLLLAQRGTRLLVPLFSTGTNALTLDLAPDGRVLAFTGGLAIAASILFGVVPASRGSYVEPIESLKEHGWSLVGKRLRLAGGFVIAQVAVSLLLVVGGGLLIRTYANLTTMDLGFDPTGVLVVDVGALKAHIPATNRLVVFEEVRQAVAAVPGVAGAAISDVTPVSGTAGISAVEVSGLPRPRGHRETFINRVSPGWLSLYRTPVLSGRDFTDADRSGTRRVAIVNQAFARQFLGGVNPLGRVVRQLQGPPGHAPLEWDIVGVTGDAVYDAVRAAAPPTMYLAFDQIDDDLLAMAAPVSASMSVRAAASPMALTRSLAAAIAKVNPNLDLTFRPLPDIVSGSMTLERTLAILSGLFGVLSLLLAAVGLYGVTSYAVTQRRTEIGIRMALGASPGLVVRQVLTRVLTVVGIGVALGSGASLWLSQFVATLLFGLRPRDPATLITAAVVLTSVGALAGWLPARRASRVDPMVALRCE
jgi:putative ABC transport system permease protein